MSKRINSRMTAKIEGDFVVFIIGMHINKPWKLHKWLPVATQMGPMIKELMADPNSGFLGSMGVFPFMVQYWRSFDHLTAYARGRDKKHFPAWVAFNKRVGSNGDVGIWHETYMVRDGEYETIYNNMKPQGMAAFGELVPAQGRYATSRNRAGRASEEDAPITPEGEIVERVR